MSEGAKSIFFSRHWHGPFMIFRYGHNLCLEHALQYMLHLFQMSTDKVFSGMIPIIRSQGD